MKSTGLLTLLVAVALAAASPALGGTVVIDDDPSAPTLTYTAAPGEANQLVVSWEPTGDCDPWFGSDPCLELSDFAGIDDFPDTYCIDLSTVTIQCDQIEFQVHAHLGDGDDEFWGWYGDSTVDAGPGNDDVRGEGGDDFVAGDAGNDTISGGPGNDTLSGGADDDRLEDHEVPQGAPTTSSGTDVVSGGSGYDRLFHHSREDALRITLDGVANDTPENDNIGADIEYVSGGNAGDTMIGNDAANELEGFLGGDTISGGGGNDKLDGDAGDDRVFGEAGDDEVKGGGQNDFLDGGSGADRFFGDDPCTIFTCTAGSDEVQARDGVADSVSCGEASDRAVVDHLDVVASVLFDACEAIDRSQPPAASPPPSLPPPARAKPNPPKARCVVPAVRNKALVAAKRAITGRGCRVGRIRKLYSARVKRGRVIAQAPGAGRRLPSGSRVGLIVSRGRRP
jgi:Ca2+-binding RTX toxin-like protein